MKKVIILALSLLLIHDAFSQGICTNIKVISPASPKPNTPVVTVTCSTFAVQWQSQPGQVFVLTAIKKDVATNMVTDTIIVNTTVNSAEINVEAGSGIRWQVEAISIIDNRNFYSYPLRGGKDYIIPDCHTVAAKGNDGALKTEALRVSPDLNNKIKIYPNPFQFSLNIEFTNGRSLPQKNRALNTIILFDANGKMISSKRTAENITRINVKQLLPGAYIIKIHDSNGKIVYNGKIVKE